MTVVYAMICGALTSAAWIAPRPWCWLYGSIASFFFVVVRRAN